MSKGEFLQNVRAARNFLTHRLNPDDPTLDPEKVEGQLARAAIWLTPSAVRGFRVREFAEFADDRRQDLANSVEQFLQVAKQVPRNGPATLDQVRDGMSAFQKILVILEPYLVESRDSKRVREILERVHFPDIVVNWNFEVGEDWTGDPVVRIHVFLKDEAIENSGWHEETREIKKSIRTAFFDAEVPWRPFVYFRTASEQRSLKNLAS